MSRQNAASVVAARGELGGGRRGRVAGLYGDTSVFVILSSTKSTNTWSTSILHCEPGVFTGITSMST